MTSSDESNNFPLEEYIKRILSGFRKSLAMISKLAIVVMMLAVFISSIMRYLFGSPIPNLVNIVERLLLPAVIWCYMAEVQLEDNHISMDLVANRIPDSVNQFIFLIFYPIVFLVFSFMFLNLYEETYTYWVNGTWTTGSIRIPLYLSMGIIALGVLSLLLSILYQWITEVLDLFRTGNRLRSLRGEL